MLSILESAETRDTPASDLTASSATPFLNKVSEDNFKEKEKQMAEVDTLMLSQEHADIRREAAEHRATITQEAMKGFDRVNADVLKSAWHNTDATKDARFDVSERVGNQGDRIVDRIGDTKEALMARSWDLGRESADNRAQILALGFQIRDGFSSSSKDTELNALKTQIETARQTTYLSDKIDADGEKTRNLLNDLKYHDLNRHLVERNAELVEERHGRRHWRHAAEQNQYAGQYAQLQSQIQAFQSQLQETRQGMVNFGTMSGQSGQQTSTSNNVR
jgi:hypothetical protein